MGSQQQQLLQQPCFAFAPAGTPLLLSQAAGRKGGSIMPFSGGVKRLLLRQRVAPGAGALALAQPASSPMTPLASCPATQFTTRGSKVVSRSLASHSARMASQRRALPFASLSLAAATLSKRAAGAPSSSSSSSSLAAKKKKTPMEILQYASSKALSGGIPGMFAMALQVLSLMWLRTTINYQYRYGTTTLEALKTLYSQGGIPRFYNGLAPALVQGPLSRFGDTAANTGVLALLEDVDLPPAAKTVAASLAAGLFRIFLMPVDALKTIMQVEGKNGIPALVAKVQKGGPTVLYHGALAASAATFVGHYPWFAVYNTLNGWLPQYGYDQLPKRLLRSALMGFCSSFVSDCCSNSIRVVKTAKQTSTVPVTYGEVVKQIVAKEGVLGLMGRGLGTKIITNGLQGILFSVLWRLGQDYYAKKEKEKEDATKAAEAPVASRTGKK